MVKHYCQFSYCDRNALLSGWHLEDAGWGTGTLEEHIWGLARGTDPLNPSIIRAQDNPPDNWGMQKWAQDNPPDDLGIQKWAEPRIKISSIKLIAPRPYIINHQG